MTERTTTVQMDKRGRVVIPKAVRQSLGIDGGTATVELDVREVQTDE
jgi:AbrB family looped-hinge helix DNA binding protein